MSYFVLARHISHPPLLPGCLYCIKETQTAQKAQNTDCWNRCKEELPLWQFHIFQNGWKGSLFAFLCFWNACWVDPILAQESSQPKAFQQLKRYNKHHPFIVWCLATPNTVSLPSTTAAAFPSIPWIQRGRVEGSSGLLEHPCWLAQGSPNPSQRAGSRIWRNPSALWEVLTVPLKHGSIFKMNWWQDGSGHPAAQPFGMPGIGRLARVFLLAVKLENGTARQWNSCTVQDRERFFTAQQSWVLWPLI